MKISAVAAISKNRVLGKANGLIYHIPEDQKRFRDITTGHPVIMGRKTYESIGRPLPNRLNIVISRDASYIAQGCIVVGSLDKAMEEAKKANSDEIFIVGGGQVYTEALPVTNRLYMTVVDQEVEGDAFFPDYSEFTKVIRQEDKEWNGLRYSFIDLERP